mgnify:CR=1 FL=1
MRSENMHHVTLETKASDFEGIEVIGADALLAARIALDWIGDLPTEIAVDLNRKIQGLRQIVESNAMLRDTSRHLVGDLIRHLEARHHEIDPSLQVGIFDQLRAALRHSQRVADLITAERHVGRARGIS